MPSNPVTFGFQKFSSTFFILLMLTAACPVKAQDSTAASYDHSIFIRHLNHSQEEAYLSFLTLYNLYLREHPDDIAVQIEKCKFIELAEYDYTEDYNPNQEAFDSCTAELLRRYPSNPDVLVYFSTFSYGDDLEDIFKKVHASILSNKTGWSKENLGTIYFKMADHYYDKKSYREAEKYMRLACENNDYYRSAIEFARILIELKKEDEASKVLSSANDTNTGSWHLSQKAKLLLELKAYEPALRIYDRISAQDSSYNNNAELATVMAGIGKYDKARKYLVADTTRNWKHSTASLNLFLHDLAHQDGPTALATYNAFRQGGYTMDALGIYRLRLFATHPFLSWKLHDMAGLLTLLLTLILLTVIPSVWILPVYFIGHKWKIVERESWNDLNWGLKSFWYVSVAYLVASLISVMYAPGIIYAYLDSNTFTDVLTTAQKGLTELVFILSMAVLLLLTLFFVNPKVFVPKLCTAGRAIALSVGWFVIFKVMTGVYITAGTKLFDLKIDEITMMPQLMLATTEDIKALLTTYGNINGLLLLGLLVPFYEEIIFRGVILESAQRYLHFGLANVLQAALFASIHQSLFLFPVFFAFGLLAGMLNRKAGGLLPGIVFHSINNLLATAFIISQSG